LIITLLVDCSMNHNNSTMLLLDFNINTEPRAICMLVAHCNTKPANNLPAPTLARCHLQSSGKVRMRHTQQLVLVLVLVLMLVLVLLGAVGDGTELVFFCVSELTNVLKEWTRLSPPPLSLSLCLFDALFCTVSSVIVWWALLCTFAPTPSVG
jgi:hypothetical protein